MDESYQEEKGKGEDQRGLDDLRRRQLLVLNVSWSCQAGRCLPGMQQRKRSLAGGHSLLKDTDIASL